MFDHSTNSSLAIIIPTKNRLFWVERLLKYYAAVNFTGLLIIVDSSDKNINEFNYYSKLYGNLTIIYKPELSIHEAIEVGLNSLPARIKYVIQTGDDDFICIENLAKLVKFLDANSDFSAAYGDAFTVGLSAYAKDKLKISWCTKYWNGFSIESDDPLIRLSELLANYMNLEFAVRRKETVFAGLSAINKFTGRKDFSESTTLEILAAVDTAMSGKVSYIKGNYLIRGDHVGRPNRHSNSVLRQYIETSKFTELKSYIRKKQLTNGIALSKNSENVIDTILYAYVEKSIVKRFKIKHNKIKALKLVGYVWRRTKSVYFKQKLRGYLQLIK